RRSLCFSDDDVAFGGTVWRPQRPLRQHLVGCHPRRRCSTRRAGTTLERIQVAGSQGAAEEGLTRRCRQRLPGYIFRRWKLEDRSSIHVAVPVAVPDLVLVRPTEWSEMCPTRAARNATYYARDEARFFSGAYRGVLSRLAFGFRLA